ncbi:MAG TPA: alpha/beta hydrolase, partial [Bacteroidetes bacterium]|nr:alpha/beta hydrolase [Bacteroidota bacterium]
MTIRQINNLRIFFILLFSLGLNCAFAPQKDEPVKKDYVVLLHGLARTQRSMAALENRLHKSGFQVVNIGYPSRDLPIEGLVEFLHQRLQRFPFAPGCKINFVTHSMGGIV